MHNNSLASIRVVLMALFLSIFVSFVALPVNAQFLPSTNDSQAESENGLDALIKEARENGSTVIILKPGDSTSGAGEDESSDRAARFFKARTRTQEIFASVPTLWPNIKETLRIASPDGSSFWALRAIITAVLGLVAGLLAIRPVLRWGREYFRYMYDPDPATTADKAKYLVFRVVIALVYIAIIFVAAMALAIIFDSGHEPSRRMVFEIILAYLFYRLMMRAVSWNVFAYDAPSHRVVNLSDDEANIIHRDWGISVSIAVIFAACARFLSFTGEEQNYAGLTRENIQIIQIFSACTITLLLTILTVKNWKIWAHIFAPENASAWLYQARTALARLSPAVFQTYMLVALVAFVYQLALGLPAPGIIIAMPFLVFWMALMTYGVVIIIIQFLYNRRIRAFEERAAAERARRVEEQEKINTGADEEIIVSPTNEDFEYQPMFKPFFEMAAMAIITMVAIGELIRSWGVDLSREDSVWAGLLDIFLAATLCWISYHAVSNFIDKRMEEEAGEPEEHEEELGGEGGGAGATRMATLLPILRYLMVITVFSAAGMVILSTLGFDIGPIFAGAGVVGIAVGFGAQTLIRDMFSGAFFLMDDAFRKGEYVQINTTKGTVEKISIRSFQLRHHLGKLHTIPFGEVTQLTNFSRDWVMTKLPLRVTYDTDVEKVRKMIKKLGQRLLEDPEVGHEFLQPLKSQGVYKMEDSAMIIRVKFMTKPGRQFAIRKKVYESIQELFAGEGIKFAHKEVTVRLADGGKVNDLDERQKQAATSAARSVIDAEAEAAAAGGNSDNDR